MLINAGQLEEAEQVSKDALDLPGIDRLALQARLETLRPRRAGVELRLAGG